MKHAWHEDVVDDTTYMYPQAHVDALVARLIEKAEAKTSFVFSQGAGWVPRNLPTTRVLYQTWWRVLVNLNKFDSLVEVLAAPFCWACGMDYKVSLQRAHILARVDGGSDAPGNLHMLCVQCHRRSETLWGKAYWDWFMDPGPVNRAWVLSAVKKMTPEQYAQVDLEGIPQAQMIALMENQG